MPELQTFADNIWTIDGPIAYDFGFAFTTRMTVVRLADRSLWVDSPVQVPFETLKTIVDTGTVRYLLAATPRHFWRLEAWHTLFPAAEVWSSRNTPLRLAAGHLPMTGILTDTPNPGWADEIDQLVFKGNPFLDEVIFLHKPSHTVILGDLIQANPMMNGKHLRNALLRLSGGAHPNGGVGFDIRLTFTNRKLARQSLERLLSWDFDKLIIAHGNCIRNDAKSYVERAFQWLVH